MVSTAAPLILGSENQLCTPNADFVLAKNSSRGGSVSTSGNLLLGATETNAVSTMLASASTAVPSGPQRQKSVDAQSNSGNKSQLNPSSIHCEVTHDDPRTIPQPRGYTETDNTGVRQLPINTIVTVRQTPHQQQFMVGYKGLEDHTEVNRVNRVTRIVSPVGTVSLSDASVGYGQCSQMAYVINGQSGYFSSEAVGSYTTPNNPPVYSGSSYQCEGRSTREFYPSRIYPEQEANRFRMQSIGHGLAAPPVPERVRLSMQQYSSWTRASLAAGDGKVTNNAAYVGAVPFPNPVNNPEISRFSNKSQLFDSLKVYLNNKNRLQPIIGLGSIIECVKAGTHNREVLYLCEVCVCRLSKADMRNHIMGSLHRYSYIKAWHPHLMSEWKEMSDLSNLAWPLMEMAKALEEKEGPGDVQWLEFEDALFQKMATHSENDAVTLITILRDGQGQGNPETTSVQQEHHPIQSQRIVLVSNNQQRPSKKSLETSAETNRTIAFIKSEDLLKNPSPEPSVLSKNSNSFLDGYTGTKPLIGIKMLCNGGTHTNTQKQKIAVKGLSVNNISNRARTEKCTVLPSQFAKRMAAKRKMKQVDNTVFKVSLPLTKGSMLLERTSFSMDSLPGSSACSPSSDSDLIPSPESQSEDCELDYDAGSFASNHTEHTSQLQQDLCRGDAGQYKGPERYVPVAQYQEVAGSFNDNEYLYYNQSEDITGTKYQKVYGDDNYKRQPSSQERSSKRFYKQWQNEGPQTQNEWLSPAVSHTQDWPAYKSSYRCEAGCTEQWYNSTSQSKVGTRISREERQNEMSMDATQHCYQQQPQNQYMECLQTGSVGQHGFSDECAAQSDAARIGMHPYLGDPLAHSSSTAPESRVWFPEIEHRPLQTYMEFAIGPVHAVQQSYMTQSKAYQATLPEHGVMSYPNHNIGPRTNSDQCFHHPFSVGEGMSQSKCLHPTLASSVL
ncbi:hypothetical protein FQN60_007460 [Etheostoma spectabile]|uniref:Uncharacterized protein n=1 Tax=Etheostoma spectabile TaxID=54343 RepID=A0A5J5D2X6_9PERO|nr:hypothetical protein FQN60_007460 [Etheostoma spectabile]